jgi:molecular chaperone HscB
MLDQCAQLLDVAHDYPGAVQAVRTLMFVDKFGQDVMARQHALDS